MASPSITAVSIGSAATAFADAGEGVGIIGRSARPEADTIAVLTGNDAIAFEP
jgi:hypothetical protein